MKNLFKCFLGKVEVGFFAKRLVFQEHSTDVPTPAPAPKPEGAAAEKADKKDEAKKPEKKEFKAYEIRNAARVQAGKGGEELVKMKKEMEDLEKAAGSNEKSDQMKLANAKAMEILNKIQTKEAGYWKTEASKAGIEAALGQVDASKLAHEVAAMFDAKGLSTKTAKSFEGMDNVNAVGALNAYNEGHDFYDAGKFAEAKAKFEAAKVMVNAIGAVSKKEDKPETKKDKPVEAKEKQLDSKDKAKAAKDDAERAIRKAEAVFASLSEDWKPVKGSNYDMTYEIAPFYVQYHKDWEGGDKLWKEGEAEVGEENYGNAVRKFESAKLYFLDAATSLRKIKAAEEKGEVLTYSEREFKNKFDPKKAELDGILKQLGKDWNPLETDPKGWKDESKTNAVTLKACYEKAVDKDVNNSLRLSNVNTAIAMAKAILERKGQVEKNTAELKAKEVSMKQFEEKYGKLTNAISALPEEWREYGNWASWKNAQGKAIARDLSNITGGLKTSDQNGTELGMKKIDEALGKVAELQVLDKKFKASKEAEKKVVNELDAFKKANADFADFDQVKTKVANASRLIAEGQALFDVDFDKAKGKFENAYTVLKGAKTEYSAAKNGNDGQQVAVK